ncbi:hypothetical protein [Pelagerythrobacter marinus]|jgi:hypothetical protein|uniref:hypothetical protein n=1 Tax=Pelagerythrobacter marinus TaxID=538382 RepID=UPI002AC8D81C|nr:hypothetical protein [Pelagerythrobacter marinus]WPZ05473.1 hypothetical protein T8T98_08510 [Pelagerythrobacter marinus]
MKLWLACLSLTRAQVRSLYSIAMLAGIIAFCGAGAVLLWFAYDAALFNPQWFRLATEAIRYIFALIAMFAAIVALTVFGADYFKAKYGDAEIEAGGRD